MKEHLGAKNIKYQDPRLRKRGSVFIDVEIFEEFHKKCFKTGL